jgi:hypothetical protein
MLARPLSCATWPTGRWCSSRQASGNSGASASTLLEAALRDFPNVPPDTRRVPLSGPVGD